MRTVRPSLLPMRGGAPSARFAQYPGFFRFRRSSKTFCSCHSHTQRHPQKRGEINFCQFLKLISDCSPFSLRLHPTRSTCAKPAHRALLVAVDLNWLSKNCADCAGRGKLECCPLSHDYINKNNVAVCHARVTHEIFVYFEGFSSSETWIARAQ